MVCLVSWDPDAIWSLSNTRLISYVQWTWQERANNFEGRTKGCECCPVGAGAITCESGTMVSEQGS